MSNYTGQSPSSELWTTTTTKRLIERHKRATTETKRIQFVRIVFGGSKRRQTDIRPVYSCPPLSWKMLRACFFLSSWRFVFSGKQWWSKCGGGLWVLRTTDDIIGWADGRGWCASWFEVVGVLNVRWFRGWLNEPLARHILHVKRERIHAKSTCCSCRIWLVNPQVGLTNCWDRNKLRGFGRNWTKMCLAWISVSGTGFGIDMQPNGN